MSDAALRLLQEESDKFYHQASNRMRDTRLTDTGVPRLTAYTKSVVLSYQLNAYLTSSLERHLRGVE